MFGFILPILLLQLLAKTTTRNRSTKYYYLNDRRALDLHAGGQSYL